MLCLDVNLLTDLPFRPDGPEPCPQRVEERFDDLPELAAGFEPAT
jgi:hypothetical protein